jgi:hypothetical protein
MRIPWAGNGPSPGRHILADLRSAALARTDGVLCSGALTVNLGATTGKGGIGQSSVITFALP